jgi:TM2 domain-containing membrane protein YozV
MFCTKCGGPNRDEARFCEKCGAPLGAAALPGAPGAVPAAGPVGAMPPGPVGAMSAHGHALPARRTVTGKNPTIALVLSIFLGAFGAGQFYNGDWKKGLAMAAGSIFLGPVTGGLVALAILIWSAVDAYQVASGKWSPW